MRRSRLRIDIVLAGSLGFGMLFLATSARGQALSPSSDGHFVLDIKECPKTLAEDVRRVVGIEVGDLLRETGESTPASSDALMIRCAGNLAHIEVSGSADSAPLEKLFQLDDFPGDAAPRALALASLELMAARNVIVRERMDGNRNPTPPSPKPEAPKPRPAPVAPEKTAPPPPSEKSNIEAHLGLAAAWQSFPAQHGPTLWGGQLNTSAVFNRLWRMAANAELTTGKNAVSMGETRATLLTLGADFGVERHVGIFAAGVGLGGRIGAVRLSGTSADPAYISATSVWRPWGGPMATAHGLASFGQVALSLTIEAGLPLLKPEGQAGSNVAIALDGPWAAIALGASIRL